MNFPGIYERLRTFFHTPAGQTVLKWGRRFFFIAILFWLIYQLTVIGWNNVWQTIPTHIAFYLLFLYMYFQLPLFEVWIYRVTWSFRALKSIPVFLVKRIYNKDVLGYSGEVYFYTWARKHLSLSDKDVFMIIKDNNIISSLASGIVAFGLLALFFFTDQIKILEWIIDQNQTWFYGGVIFTLVIAALFTRFRRFVITMPLKSAYRIYGIQTIRLLLLQGANVLMYYVVIPDAPLHVWFTLISIEIILSRIPILPNRDLIFIGLSIGLADGLAVSQTEIAGLMLARVALGKVFNLLSFLLAGLVRQSSTVPEITAQKAVEELAEKQKGHGRI